MKILPLKQGLGQCAGLSLRSQGGKFWQISILRQPHSRGGCGDHVRIWKLKASVSHNSEEPVNNIRLDIGNSSRFVALTLNAQVLRQTLRVLQQLPSRQPLEDTEGFFFTLLSWQFISNGLDSTTIMGAVLKLIICTLALPCSVTS